MLTGLLSKEIVEILSKQFGVPVHIQETLKLSEPERRNLVFRIILKAPSNAVPQSVIFKQSLPEKSDADDKEAVSRFARDWAALEFLSGLPSKTFSVPQFYGGSRQYRFILVEDLGEPHISLVDSLTLPDRAEAIVALQRFMKALGRVHATSFGRTDHYDVLLKSLDVNAGSWEATVRRTHDEFSPHLHTAHQKFGLFVTPELTAEVHQVIEAMLKPGPFTVLTHGDICPDNVFDHAESRTLQLIDFEWARVGNALLDGTYLRMSMPTCWCAKKIPEELIAPLEVLYREELQQTVPAASDDEAYHTAYVQACAFWVLGSLFFVEDVWEKEKTGPSGPVPENSLWNVRENFVRPRLLSRLKAFVDVASKQESLPHLRHMALDMLSAAQKHWPEAKPLELYPAFKNR